MGKTIQCHTCIHTHFLENVESMALPLRFLKLVPPRSPTSKVNDNQYYGKPSLPNMNYSSIIIWLSHENTTVILQNKLLSYHNHIDKCMHCNMRGEFTLLTM